MFTLFDLFFRGGRRTGRTSRPLWEPVETDKSKYFLRSKQIGKFSFDFSDLFSSF